MSDPMVGWIDDIDTVGIIEGQEPWGDWLEAVGIKPSFPALAPLRRPYPDHDALGAERANEDSRRWFVNRPHGLQVGQIYRSLHASRIVTTAPGHGATTLARYLFLRADYDALLRRSIPVLVSLEDLTKVDYPTLAAFEREALNKHQRFMADEGHLGLLPRPEESDGEFFERREDWADVMKAEADRRAKAVFTDLTPEYIGETIGTAVRDAVIRSLVNETWENTLAAPKYRDFLNADSPQLRDLQRKRQELQRFVAGDGPIHPKALEQLRDRAPALVPDDYRQLLARLNQSGGVRISLLLDLSATPAGRFYIDDTEGEYLTVPYQEALAAVAVAMKNLEQHGDRADISPPLPSLLDKTYFMSRGARAVFQQAIRETVDEIVDFPSYRPIDVFAMLAYHYPPHEADSGRRAEALAAILDSRYVRISDSRALSTEMARLEATLQHNVALNGDLTYQIDPLGSLLFGDDVLPEILEALGSLFEVVRGDALPDPAVVRRIGQLQKRYPVVNRREIDVQDRYPGGEIDG